MNCWLRRSWAYPVCFRRTARLHFSVRHISQEALNQRYADKIKRKLEEEGVDNVSELKAQVQKQNEEFKPRNSLSPTPTTNVGSKVNSGTSKTPVSRRQDNSPIRPLSSILNLDKIFATAHTVEQITALWNARHASKPGHLSAAIKADKYQELVEMGRRYPSFVLPVPREQPVDPNPADQTEAQTAQRPYEFYFLEWSFYERPPDPREVPRFPLEPPPLPVDAHLPPNPPTSLILFTPLGEYKLHNSYATSHLTLTNYTDLVRSHGIVLLRGEITPSENDPGKLRMQPVDAQLLALAMQKFYLPSGSSEGRDVLARFHEKPEEFQWEDVIRICEFKGAMQPGCRLLRRSDGIHPDDAAEAF